MNFHKSLSSSTSKLFLEVSPLPKSVLLSNLLHNNILPMDRTEVNESWEKLENITDSKM